MHVRTTRKSVFKFQFKFQTKFPRIGKSTSNWKGLLSPKGSFYKTLRGQIRKHPVARNFVYYDNSDWRDGGSKKTRRTPRKFHQTRELRKKTSESRRSPRTARIPILSRKNQRIYFLFQLGRDFPIGPIPSTRDAATGSFISLFGELSCETFRVLGPLSGNNEPP